MMMMDRSRFLALAEAYGADLRRWPDGERAAAQAYQAAEPGAARAVLAQADALDDLLFTSRPPHPSAALRERVIAAAARSPRRASWRARLGLAMGAGWAAAACAGVVAGVVMTSHLTANAQADAILYQSTLSTVDDMEVLG
jgi:hypothetical protein